MTRWSVDKDVCGRRTKRALGRARGPGRLCGDEDAAGETGGDGETFDEDGGRGEDGEAGEGGEERRGRCHDEVGTVGAQSIGVQKGTAS